MRLIWIVPVFLLAGCGGGDGDNSGNENGDNEPTQTSNSVPVDQQAKVTLQSLEDFTVGMNLSLSLDLAGYVHDFFIDGTLTFQTGDVDVSVDHPCGGTAAITGWLDEESTSGTLTITFSDYQHCAPLTYKHTGSFDLAIYAVEGAQFDESLMVPSSFLLSTSNAVITRASGDFSLVGTIEYDHDTGNAEYDIVTLTKNFNISNSDGEAEFIDFIHQSHYTIKGSLKPSGYVSDNFSGRLYDSDHGYVDLTTVNAAGACFSQALGVCPLDPDLLGRVELVGDHSMAQIHFDASASKYENIDLDSDGDGVFDQAFYCTGGSCTSN